ncbi:MAG: class I SAM-dependent methyltransferase [Alphaproteobacteria bacterium]|nr:class I SAM-dependent methyltransferase [Alphaproteobacteria bacterium]
MDLAASEPIIAWQSHEGRRIARVNGYDIIACEICGFRHALPLPEPDAMERAYRDAYYTEEKPTFLAHAGEDQQWAELAQRDRLEIFERLLGPARRKLLDIGSGPGFFLRTAKQTGWRVLGIEPSRQAAAHARAMGIEVVEGFFNEDTAPGLGRFDVVHMNNVLEHVPDPMSVVNAARDLIDRGGILCINVPNDFSPLQFAGRAAVGAGEWWLAPPHHLNYFDFESASGLLDRVGLKVVERTTSFPMELFLMMGEDYTKDSTLGRACHNRRKRFDLAFENAGLKETRRAFYRALAHAGIGREAVLIAVKP